MGGVHWGIAAWLHNVVFALSTGLVQVFGWGLASGRAWLRREASGEFCIACDCKNLQIVCLRLLAAGTGC